MTIEEPGTVPVATRRRESSSGRRAATAASPFRVTAGVLALSVAAWSVLFAGVRLFAKNLGPSTPFVGWMNLLLIIGAVGCSSPAS